MMYWIFFILLILGALYGLFFAITNIMGLVQASKKKTRTEKQRKLDEENYSQGCGCGCVIFIAFAFAVFVFGGVMGLWLK